MIKFILIILDGFGLRDSTEGNAYALADTPELDRLLNDCPMIPVETSGKYVGLPDGVMGNSEVGHTNIGAGRIVKQDLVRINDSISTNDFGNIPNLNKMFTRVKQNQSTLHLMGLISDGGVHSHIDHLDYLLSCAKENDLQNVVIHAITDGRDTPPDGGIHFIDDVERIITKHGIGSIGTVCGRYYAMDRDNRWERTEKAYKMLINGHGETCETAKDAVQQSYEIGVTDEFITPKIIGNKPNMNQYDCIFMFNFRADRMRQICDAMSNSDFEEFHVSDQHPELYTMTKYRADFSMPVMFNPENLEDIFPQVLSEQGFRQLRIAETEKYAHVTYFFNGGEESKFEGEDRILVPSPKIATYDLQPEMSAQTVTEKVLSKIENDEYEAVILNFANPDMVGHTGRLDAAIQAVETIDTCLAKITSLVKAKNGTVFLTADHGNLEMMIDPKTGKPHTAHTTLPVPFLIDSNDDRWQLEGKGKLADIAPTIMDFLDLEKPEKMTGQSLLKRQTVITDE